MNTVPATRQVSLFHVLGLYDHSAPNHLTAPVVAFAHYPSARRASDTFRIGLGFAFP